MKLDGQDLQAGTALAHRLHQSGGGGRGRAVLDEGQAFWLQAAGAERGEEIGEPLWPVDQSEPAAGPCQISGGGAQLGKGAALLAAGRSP